MDKTKQALETMLNTFGAAVHDAHLETEDVKLNTLAAGMLNAIRAAMETLEEE